MRRASCKCVAMAVARRSHLDGLCEGPVHSGVDVEEAKVERYTQRGRAGAACGREAFSDTQLHHRAPQPVCRPCRSSQRIGT